MLVVVSSPELTESTSLNIVVYESVFLLFSKEEERKGAVVLQ